MSAPPPGPANSNVSVGLAFLKGLTLGNVLAIVLLLLGSIPAYVTYRLASDPALLDRFLSSYATVGSEGACRVIRARQRGEEYTWAITSGFAFEGNQRWTIGTVMAREPTDEEVRSNCAILGVIIDFMHGDAPAPDIIWQTKDIAGREGQKGDR
jgi:hypothetical protein